MPGQLTSSQRSRRLRQSPTADRNRGDYLGQPHSCRPFQARDSRFRTASEYGIRGEERDSAVATFKTDEQGHFKISLPAGHYKITRKEGAVGVIYVADMTEPGRNFPGVEQLRELATDNIEEVMGVCIQQSVQFLVSKGVPVFPDSIDCYNEHVMKRGIVN